MSRTKAIVFSVDPVLVAVKAARSDIERLGQIGLRLLRDPQTSRAGAQILGSCAELGMLIADLEAAAKEKRPALLKQLDALRLQLQG